MEGVERIQAGGCVVDEFTDLGRQKSRELGVLAALQQHPAFSHVPACPPIRQHHDVTSLSGAGGYRNQPATVVHPAEELRAVRNRNTSVGLCRFCHQISFVAYRT